MRGFAAFRAPELDTADGYLAYNAIFDHATDAEKNKSLYPLRQSISEYVFSVSGKFNDLGLQNDPRTKETLAKAFAAYLTLLGQENGKAAGNGSDPPFAEAIRAAGMGESFVPLVEKALAHPQTPKSYGLLKTAASVLAEKQPDRAIALLQGAKPLLPTEKTKDGQTTLDLNEAGRFYSFWLDLLEKSGKTSDAIAIAKERVQLTGYGRARLLALQTQANDATGSEQTLAEIAAPTADERDVLAAANDLFKRAFDAKTPDAKAGDAAEKLLQTLLEPTRTPKLENALLARLQLGSYYLRRKETDKARAILTLGELPKPLSNRAQYTLREIERLLKKLEDKPTKR